MRKYCVVLLLLCCCALQSRGQRVDSLKTDSLKKKASAIKLNTVTVRGQKPVIEHRIDGIVFNVDAVPVSAGADATDVLRKVPMVSVDGGGGLAVRGSTNVKVFIDGKPSVVYGSSLADVLRALRGENIAQVEVITEPSARYDAEGTDAVVNIITRKIRIDITNANVSGVLASRGENIGGDIHHQRGALQVHADAIYQGYRNRNGSVLLRDASGVSLRQDNETTQRGHYFGGGISVFYSVDSLNTINIGYRYRKAASVTYGITDNYDISSDEKALLFRRNIETPGSSEADNYTIGFNGRTRDKKTEYAVLGMYTPSKNINDYVLQQEGQNNSRYNEAFFSTGYIKDYIIQADYSRTFTKGLKWESGAKLTGKNTTNNNLYQPDAGRSMTFIYKSQIYAAYTNMSLRLGKWGISGGLRYESTQLAATIKNTAADIPSFSNLIPQALVQLVVNDRTSLKLSYTKKIVRPFVSYLDPTVNTSDSLTLQRGNPKLNPEVTNRYQLSYSVNTSKLFTDLVVFINDNRNSIENVRQPIGDGRFESTWQNIGKNQRLGLSATMNWRATTAFTLGSTITTQYVQLQSNALNISNSGLMRQLVLNATYRLPQGYSVDFYGFFDGNSVRLQGYRNGWKFYNMTLNKKFKNERLVMSLRAEAFLTTYAFIDEVITSPAYTQSQSYRYQNQNIRLSVSYKIGKKEVKNLQVKNIDQ
jgi:outer membrane receptor for ferrienterochelin and colicin